MFKMGFDTPSEDSWMDVLIKLCIVPF